MDATLYAELCRNFGEQAVAQAVINYEPNIPPHLPHEDSTATSPGAFDGPPWYLPPYLRQVTDGEWSDPSDPALAPSHLAPLAQDNGVVTFPVSPTLCQMPEMPQTSQDISNIAPSNINGTFDHPTPSAPQPEPPTGTFLSLLNSTTSPTTSTPRDPKQCPACQEEFTRWQDCDRHILTHLPHWIHCPLWDCLWRGNRVKSFEQHWGRQDHLPYHEFYGGIPGQVHFEIFDPKVLLNQIKAGTISVGAAASQARKWVVEKATQLEKPSLSENAWGYKLKHAPQIQTASGN